MFIFLIIFITLLYIINLVLETYFFKKTTTLFHFLFMLSVINHRKQIKCNSVVRVRTFLFMILRTAIHQSHLADVNHKRSVSVLPLVTGFFPSIDGYGLTMESKIFDYICDLSTGCPYIPWFIVHTEKNDRVQALTSTYRTNYMSWIPLLVITYLRFKNTCD